MRSRHSRDQHGTAVLTITIVGDYDILRFASNLLYNQSEIAEMGRSVLTWQRRRMGLMPWREWVRSMYGGRHPMLPGYAAAVRADAEARRAKS